MPPSTPSLWARLRNARVPQLMGVYAGVSFAVLQGGDIFVDRLGLPNWTFFGLVILLLAGVPVLLATALVQQTRRAEEGRAAEAELLARAGAAERPSPASDNLPPTRNRLERVFTWRNSSFAGIGAVAILVLLVGGFMTLRALGIGPLGTLVAAGVLELEEPILIADFEARGGDPLLAGAVTEAFRIDLEQSPTIRVVGPGAIREGLLRMQAEADAPLHPALARELALREGIKAVLMGEITAAGQGSIVSVRLVSTSGEETLVSLRESVSDPADLIPAVDRLSNRLRERIGESLRSIRGSEPLERVSTASLPALRLYSQGVRAVDMERDFSTGIALLEDALAQDSTFAMAWRKLGVALMNGGYPEQRWQDALSRAYAHRDRLTDRERYMTQGTYYSHAADDPDRATASYRALLDLYPRETGALNNLAVILGSRGDRAGAAELYERALAVDPSMSIYHSNLLVQLVGLGQWERAQEVLDGFMTRFGDRPSSGAVAAGFHTSRGDFDRAEHYYREMLSHPRAGIQERMGGEVGLARIALIRGRVEESARHRARSEDLQQQMGWEIAPQRIAFDGVRITAVVLADTVRALAQFDSLVIPAGSLPDEAGAEGAHLEIASFLLALGETERGRGFIRRWDALELPPETREGFRDLRRNIDAQLATAVGDTASALAHYRRLNEEPTCQGCMAHSIAEIHDEAGDVAGAIAAYEAYLTRPWYDRLQADAFLLPRTHERLAALYESRGDTANARRHLERFVELWADADPPLQPRVAEARRRLEALGPS
jgi:eukaryotic-like serine/threonine-protein kinase